MRPTSPAGIYQIAHIDRLASIWCDAEVIRRGLAGANTGISSIKPRRFRLMPDSSHDLCGGTVCRSTSTRIEQALVPLADVHVRVFEPDGAPATDRMTYGREVPTMTSGRAAMVRLMHRYLGTLPDPFITLLDVHKLIYFMQAAGEPLHLNCVRHDDGPCAENLRHVLRAVEGCLIAGYADGDDEPTRPLKLVPGAVGDATALLDRHSESRARLERVSRLIAGFESSDGLELLSMVHRVMTHEGAYHPDEVVARVNAWNPRKRRQFSRRQIELVMHPLQEQRWIEAGCQPHGGPQIGNGKGAPRDVALLTTALSPHEKSLARDWLRPEENAA